MTPQSNPWPTTDFLFSREQFEKEHRQFLQTFQDRKFDVFGEKNFYSGIGPLPISDAVKNKIFDLPRLIEAFKKFALERKTDFASDLRLPEEALEPLSQASSLTSSILAKPEIVISETADIKVLDFNISNGLSGYDQLVMMMKQSSDFGEPPLFLKQIVKTLSNFARPIYLLDLSYAETYRGKMLTSYLKSCGLDAQYLRLGIESLSSPNLKSGALYRNFHLTRLFESSRAITEFIEIARKATFLTDPIDELVLSSRRTYKNFWDYTKSHEPTLNQLLVVSFYFEEIDFNFFKANQERLILRSQLPASLHVPPIRLGQKSEVELKDIYESPLARHNYLIQFLENVPEVACPYFSKEGLRIRLAPTTFFPLIVGDSICETIVLFDLLKHRLENIPLCFNFCKTGKSTHGPENCS